MDQANKNQKRRQSAKTELPPAMFIRYTTDTKCSLAINQYKETPPIVSNEYLSIHYPL